MSNPAKVLFTANVYGHLSLFHIPFMKQLQSWGYEVHAAAALTRADLKQRLVDEGIICHDLSVSRSPFDTRNLRGLLELRQLLRDQRFALIHTHTPVAAFLTRLLAKLTKQQGPVLYTVHGFHFYKGAPLRSHLLYRTIERLAARWTDGLLVMNQEDYLHAMQMGFVPEHNLFFTHGVGVDLSHFGGPVDHTGIRAELVIRPESVVFVCIGALIPRKNHRFLLRIWQQLQEHRKDCHLLVVGAGGCQRDLEQWVSDHSLPNVHFLGFRADVADLLRAADVVVLLSRQEGMPRCLMEAMAAGKPVIATDIRGSRDLVEDERNGLLIQVDDVAAGVNAFARLACDRSLREAMGQEGARVIESYSITQALKELELVYRRFLGVQ